MTSVNDCKDYNAPLIIEAVYKNSGSFVHGSINPNKPHVIDMTVNLLLPFIVAL